MAHADFGRCQTTYISNFLTPLVNHLRYNVAQKPPLYAAHHRNEDWMSENGNGWQSLYNDAVAELDRAKLLQKIELAHKAIGNEWKMPCSVACQLRRLSDRQSHTLGTICISSKNIQRRDHWLSGCAGNVRRQVCLLGRSRQSRNANIIANGRLSLGEAKRQFRLNRSTQYSAEI
jgi:hypothetical protein